MSAYLDAIKKRENSLLCHTYGRYPIAIERGKGTRLYDFDGKEYVDLLAGIAVVNLGHCRDDLNGVMAEQATRLVHVSNLFYQEPQLDLAEKLLATCHAGKVFFCNSGAEANEAAIKLARRYMRMVRGREAYEIVTLTSSFHGRTLATLTATGQDKVKEGFAPLPGGFVTVPWGDLDALRAAVGPQTAAIMVEAVQGEGGVRPLTLEYAQGLAALCAERDVLLICDEVQAGMGRTGKFWAFEHFGLKPDIFSAAKALANGLPMGAMLCTDEVAKGFVPGAHATTFGGGPVVAAVAAAVVDIIHEEKLVDQAWALGDYALGLFHQVRDSYPGKVADVRGMGLLLGVELDVDDPQAVWQGLLDRGFILNLAQGTTLRLVPPLTITKDDLDAFAAALREVLADA
ncbi:MAG: aspartate aminotransferase family protein [Desulfovibrionaceae bacterium]